MPLCSRPRTPRRRASLLLPLSQRRRSAPRPLFGARSLRERQQPGFHHELAFRVRARAPLPRLVRLASQPSGTSHAADSHAEALAKLPRRRAAARSGIVLTMHPTVSQPQSRGSVLVAQGCARGCGYCFALAAFGKGSGRKPRR